MTTPQKLDVMIIGGGIGGLCLAQGLHHAGIPVTVYERTETRTDWLQGYRIHINPHGSRALHDCLPPPAWQRFLDTVSVSDGGFGFTTEQLHDLLRFAGAEILPDALPADAHYGASRISLREVLLSGLDGVVRVGKTFERYEPAADGRVVAHFADGTSATADVLIGADGANSLVRQQLLPDAERIDTGILAIAGKHRLDGAELPRVLREDANIVIPTGRGFLFTARWQPDRNAIVSESVPTTSCSTTPPHTASGRTRMRHPSSRRIPPLCAAPICCVSCWTARPAGRRAYGSSSVARTRKPSTQSGSAARPPSAHGPPDG
jgi:2-polyprenyl-6-methoxyphenol hydroxylase-like FAD-dependent oxidoreductase